MLLIEYRSKIDVQLIQSMGGDEMVVAAAKVSTSGTDAVRYADPGLAADNAGLINFLMKCRHGSVFEHSSMTFFVHAPIFVWREWQRHRMMSYNEESARYKTLDPIFYLPERERPMMKVEGWKPGRPKFLHCDDDAMFEKLSANIRYSCNLAYATYINNLEMGIDPGLARICLPVGIYSGCWVTANPRSLMHFLSLRVYSEDSTFVSYPLYEMEMAALACEKVLQEGWPITYKAFVANGRVAP